MEQNGTEKMKSVAFASAEASIIATLATQPIWVIRTRMLLNTNQNINEITNFKVKTKEIYLQSGLTGYLKGCTLSLVLAFSGVLQMYLY